MSINVYFKHNGTKTILVDEQIWRTLFVYMQPDNMESMWQEIGEQVSETEEEKLIIAGDFNARTGQEGSLYFGGEEDGEEYKRKSKDKKVNKEGKKLLEVVEERGWCILNGNVMGDENGEITYLGAQGESVIDYFISNYEALEEVSHVKVLSSSDSDHFPLELVLKKTKDEKIEASNKIEEMEIENWTEASVLEYQNKNKKVTEQFEGDSINEEVKKLYAVVRSLVDRKHIKIKKRHLKKNKWWDAECRNKKSELTKILRKWKHDETIQLSLIHI